MSNILKSWFLTVFHPIFICDSSSVISSSVTLHLWTLHLWSQYIWYMAWLEVWPFSWSVLISGELLYHIEKNSQVSVMGVKHHYQQHSNYVISRQVSLNDGENWSTLTSFKLTKLYHMMYTVHLYTIPNRTLARQHTFGYAGFIWYCQAPVIVCCVVN